jgi:polyferredoxin
MGTYSLVGMIVILALGATIITALTLSRFYCGRVCPNTFFAHMLTFFKGKKKSFISKFMGFTLLTFLASALAFSIVAYGISSNELIVALQNLTFSGWLVIALSLLMIAEVYMIQGWYCAYLCPYGAACAILPIEGRLTYTYSDSEKNCTQCGGCVKICPIPNLDIRKGFDTRCIQCGLCEVACEKTFAKSPIDSLIYVEKSSIFRSGGRSKGITISIIVIVLLLLLSISTLTNPERLEACRLENKVLY